MGSWPKSAQVAQDVGIFFLGIRLAGNIWSSKPAIARCMWIGGKSTEDKKIQGVVFDLIQTIKPLMNSSILSSSNLMQP